MDLVVKAQNTFSHWSRIPIGAEGEEGCQQTPTRRKNTIQLETRKL